MFDWNTWQSTHIKAVDLCASIIYQHRQREIPLKALHLWPDMYNQFQGWTEKNLGRELAEREKMEFDGVYIERGTRWQSTPALIELWPKKKPKDDWQKWMMGMGRIISLG